MAGLNWLPSAVVSWSKLYKSDAINCRRDIFEIQGEEEENNENDQSKLVSRLPYVCM